MTNRPRTELDPQLLLGHEFVLDLEDLGAVWGHCFGTAPRSWAWVNRKFHREFFRPDFSTFARDRSGRVVGFFALGEASAPVIHALGLGVAPTWRGRELGRRLIESSVDTLRARRAGQRLECEVMPGPAPLYERAGLVPGEARAHLRIQGTGAPSSSHHAGERPANASSFWHERAWVRTPSPDRQVHTVPAGRFGLTREASAWLIHWFAGDDLATALEQLRERFSPQSTLVVYGLLEARPLFGRLLDAGWRAAQRFSIYRLEL